MIGLGGSVTSSGVVDSKYSAIFDGAGDFIDTGHNFVSTFTSTNGFSISMWVKPEDGRPSGSETLFGYKDSDNTHRFKIVIETGGEVSLQMTSNGDASSKFSTNPVFDDGAATSWTHIVAIFSHPANDADNITNKLYIDGVDTTLSSNSSMSGANQILFDIGVNTYVGAANHNGTTAEGFDGKIDEFAVFNTLLDEEAAIAIYNNGSPLNLTFDQGDYDNSSALQIYYKMGDGLFDNKANGIVHDQDNPGFGADLVTNGDFADDSSWSKGAGWTISGGSANGSSATGDLQQTGVTVIGKYYEVTYTISNYVSGSVRAEIANNTYAGIERSANGTYTEVMLAGDTIFQFDARTSFTGSIDNVIVKQLNGNPGVTSGGVTFSSDTP